MCLFYLKKGNSIVGKFKINNTHFCLRKYKNIFSEVCNMFDYEKK